MWKNERKKVKAFHNPPQLLVKQAVTIMLYAWITGWKRSAFLRWAVQLQNLFHAGAGAHQICCFGVNPHVVWEMTGKCNLKCIHCHAFGGEASADDELSTEEGKALIDHIVPLDIRTFVFTGGEPLLREDLFELIAYAKSRGFTVFIATNGTLITKEVAKLLRKYNVGVVIGLDGMNPEVHDSIRGVEGAYDAVIEGIENCIAEKLYLHLNIVASKRNFDEIERIIDYGDRIGVYSYFIYNFVPFGRGEEIQDCELGRVDFKTLLDLILEKQREVRAIIIPVASPEYWAYALQRRGIHSKRLINFLGHFVGGCLADKGMVYIKPNGDVWACPFFPVQVGNVRKERLDRIWENLRAFKFEHGEYECNGCKYVRMCGGCKTRMMMGDPNRECPVNKRAER
ncbi:MAG TPA: radical SAM protein [Candidatus Bathyarchaeia archaeon]|nr:radical SAM protein [Candidatus Bathyarchaeia archaeon]